MRFIPFLTVLLLALLCGFLGFTGHPGWLWGLAVAGPLALIGISDLFHPRDVLRRNYPLWIYGRYLLRIVGPYLRTYIVEEDKEGKPYPRDARKMVYARADGHEDKTSFGSEFDFYGDGYAWIQHSIAACDTPDKPPRVAIGGADCAKPYSSSLLNISAMSFGALGRHAVEALNLGARLGNFAHDTGEGGYSDYHRRHGGDIVWEVGSGYFGCRTPSGGFDPKEFADKASEPQVKMVELKLSQGAKPGHGGMLPAAKVTKEIAAVREVPAHQDCLSPSHHTAFSTPVGLLEFVARMRELSGGKPAGLQAVHRPSLGIPGAVQGHAEDRHPARFHRCRRRRGRHRGGAARISRSRRHAALRGPVVRPQRAGGHRAQGPHPYRRQRQGRERLRHGGGDRAGRRLVQRRAGVHAVARLRAVDALPYRHLPDRHHDPGPDAPAGPGDTRPGQRVAAFHEATVGKLAPDHRRGGAPEPPDDLTPGHLYIRDGEARPASETYPMLADGVLLAEPNATPFAAAWKMADAAASRPATSLPALPGVLPAIGWRQRESGRKRLFAGKRRGERRCDTYPSARSRTIPSRAWGSAA